MEDYKMYKVDIINPKQNTMMNWKIITQTFIAAFYYTFELLAVCVQSINCDMKLPVKTTSA